MVIPVNIPDKVLATLEKRKEANQNVLQYIAQILSDYVAQPDQTTKEHNREQPYSPQTTGLPSADESHEGTPRPMGS